MAKIPKEKKMKKVENRWLVSLLVVVEVVLISMAEQVTSQPTDMNSTLMRYQCSDYNSSWPEYHLSNLNTTLSSLCQKLTTGRDATAHSLINNEPVWGVAWCRGYLSVPDCLDCFDFAVDQLKLCGLSYWGRAIYTDCDVRYDKIFTEDYDIIPEDYDITSDMHHVVLCDNTTLSGRIEFQREVEFLLLDLQNAAPRTSNFYAASITNVDGNTTVYAIAECHLNISQGVCLDCLHLISESLVNCLPATFGLSTYEVCFMRYATTPFFGRNQTTDVTSILMGKTSNLLEMICFHNFFAKRDGSLN
ncbi:putative Gnk2-like domain-containing protein [Helianthus annuus]|uniref:Gnk2-like domain-containing protein n=2 Tax=Helianthus annuus TaxID=4232 RepID=A0A9K3DX92_HELAN|nr:putative Gnk2-like domain-containing protein [Helianthus annuus]